MALIGNLTDSVVGSVFPESYARIILHRGDKEMTVVMVNWYVNQEARLQNKQPVKQAEFPLYTNLIQGNVMTYFYNFLKTLPEFEGYIDALEQTTEA
jgi:hypothetical protein